MPNAPEARFCGDCGKPLTGRELFTERVWPAAEGVGQPTPSAERRQLTVMFVDLVGSTALSAQLDPEDLREIFHQYHRCCASEINKAGGFVAKYIGDGVLAYFGYPQAHEDDPEHAVRAGLAMIDAVGRLAAPQRLQVRIGIATGVVVVGDLLGAGSAREQTVVGETPNLAARLQALAEPDACVIAESTRRQIGSLFELRDLGPTTTERLCRTSARLARGLREPGARAVRGAALCRHDAGGSRGRTGIAAPPLAAGCERGGSRRAAWGRAGHRQVATCHGTRRLDRGRAAHDPALLFFAQRHGQRVPSHHHAA